MKIINFTEYASRIVGSSCINLFNSYDWLQVIYKTYGIEFDIVVNNSNSFILPFAKIEDKYYKAIKLIPFGDYILNNCCTSEINKALSLIKDTYPDYYIKASIVSKELPLIKDFISSKKGFLNQVNIQKWKESRDWKEAYERNIRNALNYGLSVRISNDFEAINNFRKLHEQLRINKFKKLPQPPIFFTNIFKEFIVNRKGFLLEAWNRDILIASWVILTNNKTLYYKFGASNQEYLHLRPNDLLFRSLMQYGSDNSFQTIDLGFSGAAKSYEGLIRFKSKEGGEIVPIYQLEYFPKGFNRVSLIEKTNYLNEITNRAIGSEDLVEITETSKKYYHKFA